MSTVHCVNPRAGGGLIVLSSFKSGVDMVLNENVNKISQYLKFYYSTADIGRYVLRLLLMWVFETFNHFNNNSIVWWDQYV